MAEHTQMKCEAAAQASLKWIADAQTKKLLDLDDIDQAPDPRWLIRDVLPETGLCFIFGEPKTRKSFVALSAAMHVAAGKPWFGNDVTQGPVVYIAAEGQAGLKKRVRAARLEYGIPGSIPLKIKPRAVKLLERPDVMQFIKDVADELGMPVLVIIDTFSRSIAGSDENSTKEVTVAIEAADDIKRAFGCNVCIVHHAGKDVARGMRGNSSLKGATDFTAKVTRTPLADRKAGKPDVVTFACDDMKDAGEFADMHFDMVLVDQAPALRWRTEAPETKDTGPKLSGKQKAAEEIVLAALREADTDDMAMADVLQRVADDPDVTTAARDVDRRKNAKGSRGNKRINCKAGYESQPYVLVHG